MKNEVNKLGTQDLIKEKQVLQHPLLYQVLLHNDDFTPMEFVVGVLEKFFYMDRRKAADVMLEAHIKGKAACGFFTKDLAETLISQIIEYARNNEHPLVCSIDVT